MRRRLFNLVAVMSLVLLAATLACWYRSLRPGDHGFDLVRWDGSEQGFLAYGLAWHARDGSLDAQWVRIRGGFAVAGRVDEAAAVGAPADPDNAYMPGVGDSRAANAGRPGRWNWTDGVWDFNIRNDAYIDTGDPLIDTSWGLKADVWKARWDEPWKGGVTWERISARRLRVPFWLLAFVLSLPLVVRCVMSGGRAWRRLRFEPRLCGFCSYDLRATPDRCPECGKIARRLPW